MNSVAKLEAEIMDLSKEDRISLVHRVLERFEVGSEDVESAWDTEIKTRLNAVDSGHAKLVSAEDVFSKLDSQLSS